MPVFALLHKSGVVAQVLHGLMLNNQQAIRFKQVSVKNYFRQIRDPVQIIRRIGKNQVVLFSFYIQVFKYVFPVSFYLR